MGRAGWMIVVSVLVVLAGGRPAVCGEAGPAAAAEAAPAPAVVAAPKGTLSEFLGKAPLLTASEADRKLFEEVKKGLLAEAKKPPLVLAKSNESYFFVMAHRMLPLMKAYAYSRDPEFIEALVPLIENILSQRYTHPEQPKVWSGWWHYEQNELAYMPMHGSIFYYQPVLMLAAAVRADPALKARYGEKVEAWYADVVEMEIPAWDKRGCWHDLGPKGGYYTHTTHYPDAATGKLVARTDTWAGSTLAYNKVHCFIDALVLLYRMTGEPWYRERIEKCERFFRSHWREKPDHVEWNYRDFSGPWDYKNGRDGPTKTGYFVHPKGGYYHTDLETIVRCYDAGLVFTQADIEKLAKTNLEFMWNGDEKDPKFKKINGTYTEEGKYGKGFLWTSLAHFSPKVRSLWKTQVDKSRGGYGWAGGAMDYLAEAAEPVSMAPRHAAGIPKAR